MLPSCACTRPQHHFPSKPTTLRLSYARQFNVSFPFLQSEGSACSFQPLWSPILFFLLLSFLVPEAVGSTKNSGTPGLTQSLDCYVKRRERLIYWLELTTSCPKSVLAKYSSSFYFTSASTSMCMERERRHTWGPCENWSWLGALWGPSVGMFTSSQLVLMLLMGETRFRSTVHLSCLWPLDGP